MCSMREILRISTSLKIEIYLSISKNVGGYLETNAERSAAAAEYSSRFSISVLSRALKEL